MNEIKLRFVERLNLLRAADGADDTVEAQAQTFRIWMWASAAAFAIIVIASVLSMSKSPASSVTGAAHDASETNSPLDQLPEGFAMAPIEPVNADSLDSIFDQHGYVDLYRAGAEGSRGKLLVRGVPLIRAPRNPHRFAVLVNEARAPILSELDAPVFVVLRKRPVPETSGQDESPRGRSPGRGHERVLIRDLARSGAIELIEENLAERNSVSIESGANP